MCTKPIHLSREGSVAISLCKQLPFEHYKYIRDSIEESSGARKVILDFESVESLPTWLVGFILHIEERFTVSVQARRANGQVCDMLLLAKLERLVKAS